MAVRVPARTEMASGRMVVEPPPTSGAARIIGSAVLFIHVLAVFIGPFTFATSAGPGMASPFAEPIRRVLRPYLDLAFLDHGYFFFAPNPGPSHLIRARLEFDDGRPAQELTFPDRHQQWPRLLYHRHFMLAEQYHSEFVPSQPPPDAASEPSQMENWRRARAMFVQRQTSFADHLRAVWGASHVTLTRLEHALLSPAEFAATRRSIQAPDTYVPLPDDPPSTPLPLPGVRP